MKSMKTSTTKTRKNALNLPSVLAPNCTQEMKKQLWPRQIHSYLRSCHNGYRYRLRYSIVSLIKFLPQDRIFEFLFFQCRRLELVSNVFIVYRLICENNDQLVVSSTLLSQTENQFIPIIYVQKLFKLIICLENTNINFWSSNLSCLALLKTRFYFVSIKSDQKRLLTQIASSVYYARTKASCLPRVIKFSNPV